MNREAGKGSLQRPTNKKKFDENFDRIFGTKDKNGKDKTKSDKQQS